MGELVDSSKSRVLISIKSFSSESFGQLKNAARSLASEFEILRISSVYEVLHKLDSGENIHMIKGAPIFEGLVVVVKALSSFGPEDTLKALIRIERANKGATRREVGLNLLAFEDFTFMSPKLTIPHPEFHRRSEELAPAAEIWGDFVHPILNKKLQTLMKSLSTSGRREFFAQGKSVLDF